VRGGAGAPRPHVQSPGDQVKHHRRLGRLSFEKLTPEEPTTVDSCAPGIRPVFARTRGCPPIMMEPATAWLELRLPKFEIVVRSMVATPTAGGFASHERAVTWRLG